MVSVKKTEKGNYLFLKIISHTHTQVYKGYSNLFGKVVALKEISLQEDEGAPFTAIR